MATEVIPRMILTSSHEPIEQERQELAKEAADLLEYSKLANFLIHGSALGSTLRKLGIAPLLDSAVKEYKAKKAKKGMWSGHRNAYVLLTVSVICGTAAWWINYKNLISTMIIPSTIILSLAAFVLGLIGTIMRLDSDFRGHRKVHLWDISKLERYGGTVPEFVLAKAVAIKKELPDTRFLIDQLCVQEEDTPKRPMVDPFLVARYHDEEYYIDVWDEKEYERKM